MQVNEIYRRGVVLGKTLEALRELVENNVRHDSDVSYIPISDSLFSTLWMSRFFAELNEACGTIIDDYEEEFLPQESVASAGRLLQRRMKELKEPDEEVGAFYERLFSMLQDAQLRRISGTVRSLIPAWKRWSGAPAKAGEV